MFGDDPAGKAKQHLVDACIEVAKNNGYSDAAGLLRGLLLLTGEPISLDELTAKTGYSKSTVSSNMSFLENQGLTKRIVTPGDKRYRYVPITNPDSLKEALLCNLKKEVQIILKALGEAENSLQDCKEGPHDTGTIGTRISAIKAFYENTEELLDILSQYSSEELLKMLKRDQCRS
jgi:HTH-type transcriptional regulator, glycine betaine synthesis regulator